MKILEDKYPKGSLPGQKTIGRYIDGTLYENLKIAAKNIVKDLTILGVCSSSTFEVGAGKSTFISQMGEAYTDLVNQYHGTNLEFSMKNIVFRPEELIKRAFELPQYSFIILDEWEELHYWSELAMALRQFFRKCRQLNLFIVIIIPNFFQLQMSYAISRSLFFVDVKFQGEFDRGYFDFYNFERKKDLYVYGKKTQNYNAAKPNFSGRFVGGYAVDEAEYRKAKWKDMIDSEERVKPEVTERNVTIKIFKRIYGYFKGRITIEELASALGVTERTGCNWLIKEIEENPNKLIEN